MKLPSVLALLLALSLLAAACGSSETDSGVATLEGDQQKDQPNTVVDEESTGAMSNEEAIFAFTACLREQGIDVDDPEVDANGNVRPPGMRNADEGDREAMREAFDACGEYLQDATFGFNREDDTERQDMMFEYAACMRDNGYDMPDPDFSTTHEPGDGQGRGGPFGSIDPDDPAFQAAQEACSDILGDFGGLRFGGPGGGGPPPGGDGA